VLALGLRSLPDARAVRTARRAATRVAIDHPAPGTAVKEFSELIAVHRVVGGVEVEHDAKHKTQSSRHKARSRRLF
jgi:hypothetical protein